LAARVGAPSDRTNEGVPALHGTWQQGVIRQAMGMKQWVCEKSGVWR